MISKYIGKDIKILLDKDKNGEYITIEQKAKKYGENQIIEFSFYLNNFDITTGGIIYKPLSNKIQYDKLDEIEVTFPVKIEQDGTFLTVEEEVKEMTKEEIEKELGYKIDIVG